MHLYASHHASWHVVHHVKKASFITCSIDESEKTRVDQVLEKVHPSVVLVPSLTSVMHLNVSHHASCHASHLVKQASFIT